MHCGSPWGTLSRFGVLSKRSRVVHLPFFIALAAAVAACLVRAQPLDPSPPPSTSAYAGVRVDDLQQQVIELQRDTLVLSESALPANRRLTVFISVEPGLPLTLESVQLQLAPDGASLARRSYTDAENDALQKGGAQRLYTGTLSSGKHVMEAVVETRGKDGAKRLLTGKASFRSGGGPNTLEIELAGRGADAEMIIHEW